jgi:hypothetical protein
MSSPYDAVLRIRRREVDDYGIAIADARALQARLEAAMTAQAETARREAVTSAADPLLSSHAYMARLRRERAELHQAGREADAALDVLRDEAAEAIAALRVTEESADQHAQEESLAAGRKEQAEFDDIAAARLVRRRA